MGVSECGSGRKINHEVTKSTKAGGECRSMGVEEDDGWRRTDDRGRKVEKVSE